MDSESRNWKSERFQGRDGEKRFSTTAELAHAKLQSPTVPSIIFTLPNFASCSPSSTSHHIKTSRSSNPSSRSNNQRHHQDLANLSIDPLSKHDQLSITLSEDNLSQKDFSSRLKHPSMLPATSSGGNHASKDQLSLKSHSDHQQSDWWEHVLPPGQLAERLRRAQRATASTSSSSRPPPSSHHRRNASTSESTLDGASLPAAAALSRSHSSHSHSNPITTTTSTPPSARNQPLWSSFAGFTSRASSRKGKDPSSAPIQRSGGRDRSSKSIQLGDEYEENASGSASGGMSAEGSGDERHTHGYIRDQLESAFRSNGNGPSSKRSSVWEDHSGSGSNGNSPILGGAAWLNSSSETGARAFSRSTSSRRSRVMSEDGLGLGQAFAPGSAKTWSVGSPSAPSTSKRLSSTGGKESPLWRSDNDHTSDEEMTTSAITTTTTSTRVRRTSTTYVSATNSPSVNASGSAPKFSPNEKKSSMPPPVFVGSQDGRPSSMRSSRSGSTANGESVESHEYPPPSRGGSFSRFSEHSAAGTTRSSAGATSISSGSSVFDSFPPRSSVAFPDSQQGGSNDPSQNSPQPQSARKSRFQNHQNPQATNLNAGDVYSSSRRMPSRSAPGSRRNSVHFEDSSVPSIAADYGVDASSRYRHHHHPHPSRGANNFLDDPELRFRPSGRANSSSRTAGSTCNSDAQDSQRKSESIPGLEPNMALVNSLSVVQDQIFSAGNLAMTLTRQLSGPLRPLFHFTLFAWISSVAFLTLAGFLIASYLLTMWDDVGSRSKRVGMAATQARRNVHSTVNWGRRMLGGNPGFTGDGYESATTENHTSSTSQNDSSQSSQRDGPKKSKDPMSNFTPFNWAGSAASFVAFRLAPTSIAGLFENGSNTSSASSSRRGSATHPNSQRKFSSFPSAQNTGNRPSSRGADHGFDSDDAGAPSHGPYDQMPPRPPLSVLIPSILFTIFLALGAGLFSLFTRKSAESAHASPRPSNSKSQRNPSVKGRRKNGGSAGSSSNRNPSTSSTNPLRERRTQKQNIKHEDTLLRMYHSNEEGGYEFGSDDDELETIC